MILATLESCKELLSSRGIVIPSTGYQVIDVGSAYIVSVDGGARANPVLEAFPNAVMFDGGFTVDHFQTKADYIGDITDKSHGLDGKFDIVLSFDTLEHTPDPRKFIAALVDIAKPGGLVFVAAPFQWPFHEGPGCGDYFRYTPNGLAELFKNTRAVDVVTGWTGTTHAHVIAKVS